MEEKLESFVNLLNRQRQARAVPEELAKLPNWAQRELSKHPEATAPRKAPPVNGTSHDDKPKPEIVVEAKRAEPPAPTVETKPVEAKPAEIKSPEIKPVEIKPAEVKQPETKPAAPAAPSTTAADRVRDPQSLLARFLAEETKALAPKPAAPAKPAPSAPVIVTKAPATIDAPPVAPATEKKIEAKPPLAAEKTPEKIVAAKPPAEKIAPEKIAVAKVAPEKILGEKKIEPAVAKAAPAPTSNSAAEIGPFQPAIAETLATPHAKRPPLAYALAAAAVIAVVALVVGGYWFMHQHELVADNKIEKPSQPPVTVAKKPVPPMVAAKPATPTPAAPEKKIAAKPEAAPPKVAVAPKPAEAPKPETKIAVAPPPTVKPAPPIVTPPAEAANPFAPKPPVVTVQKTPDKPTPVTEAKPSPPPVVVAAPKPTPVPPPVVAAKPPAPPAAPVVAAKPTAPSAPPPQLAMLTPPAPPAATPTKPAVAPVKPSKPSGDNGSVTAGEPTWRRNAVAAPPFTGQPQIAIVIDDLGLDRDRTERAVALKGPVTLSFLAYASDLPKQTEAARRAGHELIVHVPMEPIVRPKFVSQTSGGNNPARAELLRRLRWDLGRFDGYVGVNNHMGNRLSADPEATQTVIGELKARGLLFLDSRVGGALSAAERQGVPTVTRDVLLDDDVTATSVNDRLADLEKIARSRGTAIAIGHPHDQTLDALTAWLAALPSKGFQLVPLTAIVKDREQHIAGAN